MKNNQRESEKQKLASTKGQNKSATTKKNATTMPLVQQKQSLTKPTNNDHSYTENTTKNSNCEICRDVISEDDPGIQCEVCDPWYCLQDSGMSQIFYEELLNTEQYANIIWYCNACKKAIPGVKKVLNAVSSMKKTNDEMKVRLDKLEEKINCAPNTSQTTGMNLDYKIDQAIHDLRERDARKNNLILYKLQESDEVLQEEVLQVFQNMKLDKIQVRKCHRICEKKGNNDRPVKIEVASEDDKYKILKSQAILKTNKDKYEKVYFTPDYTIRQREMNKKMKEEVEKRRREGESDFTYKKLKAEMSGAKTERSLGANHGLYRDRTFFAGSMSSHFRDEGHMTLRGGRGASEYATPLSRGGTGNLIPSAQM